jgi:DNA-directed RNA polymerase subunit RPC12/RpoP
MKLYCSNPQCNFEFEDVATSTVTCPKCGGGFFCNTLIRCPHCFKKIGVAQTFDLTAAAHSFLATTSGPAMPGGPLSIPESL